MDLYLQNDHLGDRTAVRVMGEVDMSNSDLLKEYLIDAINSEQKDLFLNLAELSFIDSSGLTVLLGTRKLLQSFDRSLVLVSPSQVVCRVLAVTGLDQIFEVETISEPEFADSGASAL